MKTYAFSYAANPDCTALHSTGLRDQFNQDINPGQIHRVASFVRAQGEPVFS
jgi:hypothetical protein